MEENSTLEQPVFLRQLKSFKLSENPLCLKIEASKFIMNRELLWILTLSLALDSQKLLTSILGLFLFWLHSHSFKDFYIFSNNNEGEIR